MSIKVYSTEKRTKEDLQTKEPGRVNMYVCGPTVYDSCHIGHARPAVVFDTIRRYLEYTGYVVTFISNITDIDDKIINRSRDLGISWRDLARRYQDEYEQDMAALGVLSPTIRPRAAEHNQEMIARMKGLGDTGVACVTSNGVWFDVTKFADYGRLSGRSTDDEKTEHRVEQDSEKRHPQDFALWKSAKPGEPLWESPWGPGRPGWHIECSAMSGKYCDFELDIHGGGADLQFPHHENELAQSEAFTGKRFARYWLHNGFITVGKAQSDDEDDEGEKMGKSKGNAFWLRDAFKVASPAALRLWILGTHYRMPLLYRPEFLTNADNALDRIYTCIEEMDRYLAKEPGVQPDSGKVANAVADIENRFRDAMNDDFNTPQAQASVYEAGGVINSGLKEKAPAAEIKAARNILFSLLGVLGLPLARQTSDAGVDGLMDLFIALRTEARQNKDFALSDRIRDGLGKLGVTINDRGGESTWTRK